METIKDLTLSAAQHEFIHVLDTKYKAYVGGFGSGKTFVGCIDLILFMCDNPNTVVGYFGQSYPSIRDIFYPTFEEAADILGLSVIIKQTDKEVKLMRDKQVIGTVICRSMDNPSSIVGFKISRALVDELDVLSPDKAKLAWNKIIARMRLVIGGVKNCVCVTTTPEGFKFVYQRFAKNPTASYSMVQASTYENAEYLPSDYISSLKESYDSKLIEAYLNGEFVNLTSGTVYYNYCKNMNNSTVEIDSSDKTLLVGMDFNVTKMAARVLVRRGNDLHCVDELNGLYDTADMIEHLKLKYPDKRLIIYPDASGDNRKTSADETDIQMLKAAGFTVRNNPKNPRVRSRINAVNAALKNAKGETRLFVNQSKCPQTVEDLLQQVYTDKGEPDKSTGNDHGNDALGYVISYEMPINANKAVRLY